MTGSIVANQGFVNQFGTELDAKGNKILAADHLALWGGMGSLGQGLGMVTTHLYVPPDAPWMRLTPAVSPIGLGESLDSTGCGCLSSWWVSTFTG